MRTIEQEESPELHIARDAFNAQHGHFVNLMLEAFMIADSESFELLRPVMRELFKKYDVRCNCDANIVLG